MPPFQWQQAAREMGMFKNSPAFAMLQGPRVASSAAAANEPYYATPEEEESAIRKAGSWAVGGLTVAGAALDYDSGAIRNMLVGKAPRLNPFSFEGQATGRDVLEHYGVVGPNRPGFIRPGGKWYNPADWDWGDLAGFGAEVALDPKTYFTFGGSAVTKAGKALKEAGLWEHLAPAARAEGITGRLATRQQMTPGMVLKNISSDLRPFAERKLSAQASQLGVPLQTLLDEKIGGAARFWPTGGVIGKAGPVGDTMAKVLDPIAEGIRYGKYSPVRYAYGGLSPVLKGKTEALTQQALYKNHAEQVLAESLVNTDIHRDIGKLATLGHLNNPKNRALELESLDVHRRYVEGTLPIDPNTGAQILPSQHEAARPILDRIRARQSDTLTSEQVMGLNTDALKDFIDYARRGKTFWDETPEMGGLSGLKATHPSQRARKEFLEGWKGGTSDINILSTDENISGTAWRNQLGMKMSTGTRREMEDHWITANPGSTRARAVAEIRRLFPSTSKKGVDLDSAVRYIESQYGNILPADMTKNNLRSLATMLSELDPRHGITKIPLFGHHPLVDDLARQTFSIRAKANAATIYDLLGETVSAYDKVVPGAGEVGLYQAGRVSLADAIKNANLKSAGTNTIGTGAVAQMIKRLPDDVVAQDPVTGMLSGSIVDKIRAESGLPKHLADQMQVSGESVLGQLYVPAKIANDVASIGQQFTNREVTDTAITAVGKFYDSWLNFFKGHVTAYWPAFISRNILGGTIQNQLGGAFNRNPFARDGAFRALRDTFTVMRGGVLPGVMDIPMVRAAGITDPKKATRFVMTSLSGAGLGGKYQREYAQHLGEGSFQMAGDVIASIPGANAVKAGDVFGNLIPRNRQNLFPWRISGVGKQKESDFFLMKFGEDANYIVETLNRYAPALAMVRRGVDPLEAVTRANLLQVNYRAVGQADKYIRRAVPFFCVPTSHEILTQDGWKFKDDLTVGEMVLSLNHEDGTLHWTPVEAISVFDFDGELLSLERNNGKTSFQFTEDHRWPILTKVRSLTTNGKRYDYPERRIFATGRDLLKTNCHRIPCAGEFCGTDSILSPRLAAILGWVITDGYHRWRGNYCEMLVYQSPKKHLDAIIDLLGTKPRTPHPDTGVVAVPVALEDSKILTEYFHSKDDMPSIVTRLSREAADAMWQAMVDAEASIHPETNIVCFAQSSGPILEAFQILSTLTGRSANISGPLKRYDSCFRSDDCELCQCYVRGTSRTGRVPHYIPDNCGGLKKRPYNGEIWCPQTKYGTWVMRHNGSVIITGNSFVKGQSMYLAGELTQRPGGRLAQAIRAEADLQKEGLPPAIPEHIRHSASIPLGTDEQGGVKILTSLGLMHEDPFQFLGGDFTRGPWEAVKTMGSTAMHEAGSRLAPQIATPISLMTGHSLWQSGPRGGRALVDQYGHLGGLASKIMGRPIKFTPAIEQLPQAIGMGRAVSSLGKLVDTRKTWPETFVNLGLGAHLTTVDQAQQAKVIGESLAQRMTDEGASEYSTLYFPKWELEQMPPEERQRKLELAALNQALAKKRRAATKARNAARPPLTSSF